MLQEAHDDFAGGVSTVLFQIELPLERVGDRFGSQAERLEEPAAGSFGFGACGRAQQLDAVVGDEGLRTSGPSGSCS